MAKLFYIHYIIDSVQSMTTGKMRHVILFEFFLYKLRVFETFISIQVLLKAFNSLFAPKLLFIEVFGVSVQLYLDLDLQKLHK